MTWDIWRTGNFIGMLSLLILFCALIVWPKVGGVLAITWCYFLGRALAVFLCPASEWPQIGTQLDQTSGQAFAELLFIPLVVLLLPPNIFKWLQPAFTVFVVIDSLFLIFNGYGAMNASSFDAGMIAATLPLFNPFIIFFGLIAILLSEHAATAIAIIVAQLFVSSVRVKDFAKTKIVIGISLLAAAYFFMPSVHSFDSSGRVDAWKRFFEWWYLNASALFGTGTGTFQWLSLLIDGFFTPGKAGEVFLQMHNDWLQILFEGGAIGLILTLASLYYLIKKAWDRPRLLVTLIGLAVFGLTYHPLRFFPSSLFIALVIRAIIDPDVETI